MMKRIIDDKVYDTDAAEEVARRWNGWGGCDYRAETLYRGRNGCFTEWEQGEYYPDRRTGIRALDDEAAAGFVKDVDGPGRMRELFGDVDVVSDGDRLREQREADEAAFDAWSDAMVATMSREEREFYGI